jgi:hypothetical protein
MKELIAQLSSARARRGWKETSGLTGKETCAASAQTSCKTSGHRKFSEKD